MPPPGAEDSSAHWKKGNTMEKPIEDLSPKEVFPTACCTLKKKGEEQFNVVVTSCDLPPGGPYDDFKIEAYGLSTKTNKCPPYEDMNYAEISFKRRVFGSRRATDAFHYSSFSCGYQGW